MIRAGAVAVALGAAGFAIAIPGGALWSVVACAVCQGAGFGISWPSIVHRSVRFASPGEEALVSASPSVIQRIGYAVGTAFVGVAANLSGLAQGVSVSAAQRAAVWVFASVVPFLAAAIFFAWKFSAEPSPRA